MKRLIKISSIIGVVVIGVVFGVKSVGATSSFFLPTSQTATATSSVNYMTAGNATTTLVMDSFGNGIPRLTDNAVLFLQTVASSTSAVYKVAIQYSMDNQDWYNANLPATTTVMDISVPYSYKLTAVSTATTSTAINVSVPTRYARVVISITGASGGVWAQFQPSRQAQQ